MHEELSHQPSAERPQDPSGSHRGAWLEIAPDRRAAWTGFLRVHAEVTGALDRDLEREHGLSLRSYDVLIQLSLASARGRRMSELADAVLLSRSGLTRLVERLERDGLVQRRAGERDPRQTFAAITQTGLEVLARTTPTHLRGVTERFLDQLTDAQAKQLAEMWLQVLDSPEKIEED